MVNAVDTFAFIIRPIDPKRDVSRKFPFLGKHLSVEQINFFSTFFPPVYISHIESIHSNATGKEIEYTRVQEIDKIEERHGFQLSGFRSFEKAVTQEQINTVKDRATLARKSKKKLPEHSVV